MAPADREGDGRCAGERWNRRQHAPPAPRRPRLPRGHKLETLYGNRRRIAWINAQRFFVDQDREGRGEDSDPTHGQAASRDLLPRWERRPPRFLRVGKQGRERAREDQSSASPRRRDIGERNSYRGDWSRRPG